MDSPDLEIPQSGIKLPEGDDPFFLSYPKEAKGYLDENKRRMTLLKFPSPFYTKRFIVDGWFRLLKNDPGIFVELLCWHIVQPHLKTAPSTLEKFWNFYKAPTALSARKVAVYGRIHENWKHEIVLLRKAQVLSQLTGGAGKIRPFELQPMETAMLQRLGLWVLNAVDHDPSAFSRVHELLKLPGGIPEKTTTQATYNGQIFCAFASLVGEIEALPTKAQVRQKAGIVEEDEPKSKASRAFAELGLKGLVAS